MGILSILFVYLIFVWVYVKGWERAVAGKAVFEICHKQRRSLAEAGLFSLITIHLTIDLWLRRIETPSSFVMPLALGARC
jgi:hypothetical protein